MATTLIALGANLGDRQGNLQRAIALLDRPPVQRVVAHSRWFSTAAIGGPAGQAEFVNAAARVETSLSPLELLAVLREIEAELGRQRRERWAARCVDLDLLLFDDLILKTPELELPHPRMAFRRFVLEPAADVAADLLHPVIGWTMGQLLTHLNGAPNYLAITGLPGVGKTELAQAAAAATSSVFVADPAAERSPLETTAAQALAAERARWRQRSDCFAASDGRRKVQLSSVISGCGNPWPTDDCGRTTDNTSSLPRNAKWPTRTSPSRSCWYCWTRQRSRSHG